MSEYPDISELVEALQLTTGAVVALQRQANATDKSTIKFTGDFAQLGTLSIGQILDRANDLFGAIKAADDEEVGAK